MALQHSPPTRSADGVPPDNFVTPMLRRSKRKLNDGELDEQNNIFQELLKEIKSLKSIVMASETNIKLILETNKDLRNEIEFLKGIVDKNNMSDSVNKELTKEIKKIIRDDKKISYSETVKCNEPVVVIVPKNSEQKSEVTKAEIKNTISPTSNKVSGLRNAAKGAIVVECKNKEAVEKLRKEAVAKLGEKYDVNIPVSKNPRFKIVNMCDKLSEETIINNIKKQNEFVNKKAVFKVIKIMEATKRRFPDFTAVVETDIDTYENILKNERLSIGWDRCRVFEHVYVNRCYKCLGFNHTANTCSNKKACSKCAEEHEMKDCNSDQTKCVNCLWAVKNLNIRLEVNHNAFSNECVVLQRKIERERKKIYCDK